MNFSVNTFTNLDRVVHPFQLKKGDYISLNVDHKIGGVGNTPVPVMPEYKVYPVNYDYTIYMMPEINNKSEIK